MADNANVPIPKDGWEPSKTTLDRTAMRKLWNIYDLSLGVGGFVQEVERTFVARVDRSRLEDLWLAFDVAVQLVNREQQD